jgi:hypothetical protein
LIARDWAIQPVGLGVAAPQRGIAVLTTVLSHVKHRGWLLVVLVVVIGALAAGAAPASAFSPFPECSASVVQPLNLFTAATDPCSYQETRALAVSTPVVDAGLGTIQVTTRAVDAITDVAPLHYPADIPGPDSITKIASADIDSVTITVGLTTITATGLRAAIACDGTLSQLVSGSTVAQVTINGTTTNVGDNQIDLPVPGVGTLHLNAFSQLFGFAARSMGQPIPIGLYTSRALWLETGADATDVIVGEGTISTSALSTYAFTRWGPVGPYRYCN